VTVTGAQPALIANTALTGATYDVDSAQQFVSE
jgi:hypothetical protein